MSYPNIWIDSPRKSHTIMFNNSCNHNAFIDDALVISRINMKNDGKQLLFYNSKMSDNLSHIIIFTDVNDVIRPKNIWWILEKCDLWILDLKRKCNTYI